MDKKFVVLVPARSGSQRILNKNFRDFADSSLIEIKLKQALRIFKGKAKIIFNTDSKLYLEKYANLYDEGVLRPRKYATSEVPMNDVYEYFAENLKNFESIIYLNPTSPLLKDKSIKELFKIYKETGSKGITTVTEYKEYLWINKSPINYDPKHHPRSQDLPAFQTLNFAASILKIDEMKKNRNIILPKPNFYKLDNIEAFDIDEEWQFELAESLYRKSYLKSIRNDL